MTACRPIDRLLRIGLRTLIASLVAVSIPAQATYWNLFNFEEEAEEPAVLVSYGTLADMLTDSNRTGLFVQDNPFAGPNLVGTGSDGQTYWNLFNFEEEAEEPAVFVTYATLADMFTDSNRMGLFVQDNPFAGPNLIETGSDGQTYWNLFNFEEEAEEPAVFVTYASLADMLTDTNRTGLFVQDNPFAGPNLVGTGSDGQTYWNLFNFEEEAEEPAVFVTYANLADMLTDSNRTGLFVQDNPFAGPNLIGTGAEVIRDRAVPEPSTWGMMIFGFGAVGLAMRRRQPDMQRLRRIA